MNFRSTLLRVAALLGTAVAVAPSNSYAEALVTEGAEGQYQATSSPAKGKGESEVLQEVVVTAQKQEERVQDVPVPVTSVSGDWLLAANQVRLSDYYTQIPGLVLSSGPTGESLAIRGIVSSGNPTVSVTIDDVLYGSATAEGGNFVPDIDPSELARVEVLRGPQGTLYGASGLGGLVKYVTLDPSLDHFSARVETGTSAVHNGSEPGYTLRGAVNVPISDSFALRASAFARRDPGYIDNPILHNDGVNESNVSGGRLSALWHPSNAISLRFSALLQDSRTSGIGDVHLNINGYPGPPLYGLQQNYIPGAGVLDHKLQAYTATLKADLGFGELTSVSAYNVSHMFQTGDYSWALGPVTAGAFGVPGTLIKDNTTTSKVTQELRLATHPWRNVDWLFGLYYDHDRSPYDQSPYGEAPDGVVLGQAADFSWHTTYTEYSAFTDLTFHFTDQFDIQVGGRATHIDESYSQVDTGPLVQTLDNNLLPPVIYPLVRTSDNASTFLFTPRYKISPDLMVYGRAASGYRPGGPNPAAQPFGLPLSYRPDKTQNYEIGVKGQTPDQLLSFDASLYYINWQDIQLTFIYPANGYSFFSNGSRAKSQGVEVTLGSRPVTGMLISTWVAYNDAVLTEPLPPQTTLYGVAGDRVPGAIRFSGSFSVQQDFNVTSKVNAFVGATVSYQGERLGGFPYGTTSGPRQFYNPYAKTDLRAGVDYESWNASFYVNNVTDKRGLISGGVGYPPPFAFVYIQPRTVGLTLTRRF